MQNAHDRSTDEGKYNPHSGALSENLNSTFLIRACPVARERAPSGVIRGSRGKVVTYSGAVSVWCSGRA